MDQGLWVRLFGALADIIREAAASWIRNRAPLLAGALAFYMVFSLAPLLLISVGVAGMVFDRDDVEARIVALLRKFVGPQVAQVVQQIYARDGDSTGSVIAQAISTGILFFAASAVFNQLRAVLDTILGVPPKTIGRPKDILHVIGAYLWSLAMALTIGLLLLLALLFATVVSFVRSFVATQWPHLGSLLRLTDAVLVLGVLPLFCSILFMTVPSLRMRFRDVWPGSIVTSLLLAVGTYLFSLYLSIIGVVSFYGAATSLVALLLWVFFSAQIFLFGAEFTLVYARRYGSLRVPVGETPEAGSRSIAPAAPKQT